MGTAGFYQFGWSSIRLPLGGRLGAPETALGTVFTLFVVTQTLSQIPAGMVRDRIGPRIPLVVGAFCLAGGFAGLAVAGSLPVAYVAYAVGGVGAGVVYTVAINTAVKWFDERRGLASGVVTMAYSGLSVVAIPFLRGGLTTAFERTLVILAVVSGGVALAGVVVLRDPDRSNGEPTQREDDGATAGTDTETDTKTDTGTEETATYTWRETIRTWQFWLLYAVFAVVNGVGLMIIGKVVSYANALALSPAVATASASFVALAEAIGIVLVGGVSDRFGHRRTVAASLVLTGLSLGVAIAVGTRGFGTVFVAFVALTMFFRGPTFAVFPTIVGEYFGVARSSENYALLYTAKLFGGVFGGTITSGLVVGLGWSPTFGLGAVLIVVAGVAMVALRPV